MNHHARTIIIRMAGCAALLLGLGAAIGAQEITIKCWKEGCITVDGKTSCIREQIPCPSNAS